jgi:hypothetical protein
MRFTRFLPGLPPGPMLADPTRGAGAIQPVAAP